MSATAANDTAWPLVAFCPGTNAPYPLLYRIERIPPPPGPPDGQGATRSDLPSLFRSMATTCCALGPMPGVDDSVNVPLPLLVRMISVWEETMVVLLTEIAISGLPSPFKSLAAAHVACP